MEHMRVAQTTLKSLGFDPGPIDGVAGPKTAAAFAAFLARNGLHFTVSASRDGMVATGPVARPAKPTAEPPWITEGRKVFGLHEVRDNAKLRAWLKSDGKTLGNPAALPWCGDWTETCIKNTLPDEPFPGDLGLNPYWARNWLLFGVKTAPVLWSIGVFERPGGGGHVGILVGQDRANYFVFGGNQGDSVSIRALDRHRLLGARWPSSWPIATTALPAMDARMTLKSSNEF